jgi:hypothetical protein
VRRGGRRGRKRVVLLLLAAAAAGVLAKAPAERAIRARLEHEARRRGLVLGVEGVRAGIHPLVALDRLRLERPGLWTLEADSAALTSTGRLRLGPTRLAGPAGLTVDVAPTGWQVEGLRTLALREPHEGLRLQATPDAESQRLELRATDVPAGALFGIGRAGVPLLDAGVVSGLVRFAQADGATSLEVDLRGEGVRLAAFASEAEADDAPAFGPPTAVQVRLDGTWRPQEHRLDLPRWRVETNGAVASGSLVVDDLPADPRVDLALEVERVDFARLLEMSALEPPRAVSGPVAAQEGGLGSASLTARVRGRLQDASSFTVSQRLDFTPPARPLPALERLRGDFVHEVATSAGVRSVWVSPASPDFIALADVPPLFLETLLLGEDYGFHGHRGIDLSEVPSALLKNWSRGGSARGASTITQQLAKNLFLSRDKRLGRKLQELSLALLLEATLDKGRILEIYLNVIEWGPDLHGLRPATRRYFAREPRDLTPAQMAFLVALIPGPIKYQRSFADGTLSPRFRPLVDNLLAKLRSVGGLGEEEYRTALAEEIDVLPAAAGELNTR